MYDITVLEEYAKINDLTGIITVTSWVPARAVNLSIADTVDGTYVWIYSEEEFPSDPGTAVQGHNQDFLQQDHLFRGRPGPDGGQTEGAGGQPRVEDMVCVVLQCSTAHPHP
jgi:hypothetical protein